ncbi:MAG TPA: hypothetical protein VJ822_18355 [Dongiaceae bacterium]|nr:hypothetical protein [Dongiaceae bacterium]
MDAVRPRQVADCGQGIAAGAGPDDFDHRLQRSAVAAEESDLGATVSHRDREGAAQATARAGDDDTPPGQRLIGCHMCAIEMDGI